MSVSEPTMDTPVEQCGERLVESQQLRLRLTAWEQQVTDADHRSSNGELVKQASSKPAG